MSVSLNFTVLISVLLAMFVIGLPLHVLCRRVSAQYCRMTESFESAAVACFTLSLLVNWLILHGMFSLGRDGATLRVVYMVLLAAALLSGGLLIRGRRKQPRARDTGETWIIARIVLYSAVFVVMIFNGGLIEQIADSWWHMSLANKIISFKTFDVANHLSGLEARDYPSLWHGNLALLQQLSDVSLPRIWISITPILACLKVMALYLAARGITGSTATAVLSAVLFCLLPGIGDSYFRVSAWPSHVSYILLFCSLYVTFMLIEILRKEKTQWNVNTVRSTMAYLMVLATLMAMIFLIHTTEMLWFAAGVVFYLFVLQIIHFYASERIAATDSELVIMRIVLFLVSTFVFFASIPDGLNLIRSPHTPDGKGIASLLVWSISIVTLMILYRTSFSRRTGKNRWLVHTGVLILLAAVLISIDFRHAVSLLLPQYGYGRPSSHEAPLVVAGLLGGEVYLPAWQMQLRGGLLYSGISAILLSVLLLVVQPNRATVFLAANAVIPFVLLISPYLYTWLTEILNYHSVWRITILIFHPIILAHCLVYSWKIFSYVKNTLLRQFAGCALLLVCICLIVVDSRFHFSRKRIDDKIQHGSAVRHWGLRDMSTYILRDSSMKYETDFARLRKIVQPGHALLADRATSYYAAAYLPVYIRNVQYHHGIQQVPGLKELLQRGHLCYMADPYHLSRATLFLQDQKDWAIVNKVSYIKYILLNRDKENMNVLKDCLAVKSSFLATHLLQIASLRYQGEYLDLYELN